jgi:hypothetical protein
MESTKIPPPKKILTETLNPAELWVSLCLACTLLISGYSGAGPALVPGSLDG